MAHRRSSSAAPPRPRWPGFALVAVTVALLAAIAVNIWLAVTMAEWWPLLAGAIELVAMVMCVIAAFRYLRN